MKRSKLLSGIVILSCLLLVGCGGGNEAVSLEEILPAQNQSFQIGDTTWQLSLPAGWEVFESPQGSAGVVMLANRGDASLVLLQKAGAQFANAQNILSEAKEDFEIFEVTEQVENGWTFRGKLSLKDPLRVYQQQVFGISGTNNYLYASCSYPVESALASDCTSLLRGLGEVE